MAGAAGSRFIFARSATQAALPAGPQRIPRYRGFNIQWEQRPGDTSKPAFEESDFAMMQEWGFNFARLPLSYWIWGKPTDWTYINDEPLKQIDRAIDLGKQYGVHINLNFHRIPGYCINGRELEPADLFTGRKDEGPRALRAACFHWAHFAHRYRNVPSSELSFDLINEPPKMRSYEGSFEERYVEVVRALVAAIRTEDPNRLIFADGINIGQNPVLELADLGLVQSTRGYQPKSISHYGATWVPLDEYETMKAPTWPLTDDKGTSGMAPNSSRNMWTSGSCSRIWACRCMSASGAATTRRRMKSRLPGCPTVWRCGATPDGETRCGTCAAISAFWTATART